MSGGKPKKSFLGTFFLGKMNCGYGMGDSRLGETVSGRYIEIWSCDLEMVFKEAHISLWPEVTAFISLRTSRI